MSSDRRMKGRPLLLQSPSARRDLQDPPGVEVGEKVAVEKVAVEAGAKAKAKAAAVAAEAEVAARRAVVEESGPIMTPQSGRRAVVENGTASDRHLRHRGEAREGKREKTAMTRALEKARTAPEEAARRVKAEAEAGMRLVHDRDSLFAAKGPRPSTSLVAAGAEMLAAGCGLSWR